MNSKLVSVVIPTYNAEKYIVAAVDSVLEQTYENLEVVIIDDCSTDNTSDILKKYKDPRIKIVRNEENLGISKSLNKGIALTNGYYIARMDADDICISTRIQEQVNFMEQNLEIDICGTFIETFGMNNRISTYPITSKEIKINLMFGCCMAHPTILFRRTIIDNYQYSENSKVEDYLLWVELTKKGYQFYNIPKPLLKYRIHQNSLSHIKVDNEKKRNLVKDYIYTLKEANRLILNYELGDKDVETLFLNPDMLYHRVYKLDELLKSYEKYYYECKKVLDEEELVICKSSLSIKLYEKCIMLSQNKQYSINYFRRASFNVYKNSIKKNLVMAYLYLKSKPQ